METGVVVAIFAAVASLPGAALSFLSSMRKEREADWRKVIFEHYREFMTSLSGIVGSDATPEGHLRFAQASNTVQVVASRQVTGTQHDFRDYISASNRHRPPDKPDALNEHEALLSILIRNFAPILAYHLN